MMRMDAAEGRGPQNLCSLQEDARVCISRVDKIFVHYRGTLESVSITAGPLESIHYRSYCRVYAHYWGTVRVFIIRGTPESVSATGGPQSLCAYSRDCLALACYTGVGIARQGQLLTSHLLPPVLNLPHWGSRGSPGAS